MLVDVKIFLPILIGFLLILGFLAWLGYKRTSSTKDYLLAGGSVNPYMMALSYGAAFISTSAIIGFGGLAGKLGFSLMWVVFLNIAIGILIAYMVFGKRMRQMGKTLKSQTFSEFLGKRFGSSFAQWFSGLVIFIFMPLYAAAVMKGAAEFMVPVFGIDIAWLALIYIIIVAVYVITGGLKGVVYSDSLLGSIMLVSMIGILVFIYIKLGGITSAHSQLTSMSHLITDKLAQAGHTGWTSFPVFNSQFWWLTISTLMMGIGVGVLSQPQLLVRFMTVKSNRDLTRAMAVGAVFILIVVGGAYIAGSLSNVAFFNDFGKTSMGIVGSNVDQVIPQLITTYMPKWFVYVFLLTLISAGISTSSAQFHTIGTSIGKDVYEDNIAKNRKTKNTLLWKRVGIAVSIIITFILGIFILPAGMIAKCTAFFFAIAAGTFLAPTIGALFWRGATKAGAISSMIVGLAVSLLWTFIFNGGTLGIKSLTNIHPLNFIEPGFVGLLFSIITLFVVSKYTNKLPQEHIDACFARETVSEN